MSRLAISVAVLSGLISALDAHKASAQLGLDSIVRQLGERAVEELVRPDPPQKTAPRTTAPTPQRRTAPSGPTQSEVLEVQQGLVRLGYNPGTPDGLMGPNTASAIAAFQRDRGLRQTGAVTDALLTRLRTPVAGSGGSGGGAAPQDVARPSFNCARAGTPTEYAICGNPELARLDRQMADAYAVARAQAANPSVVANAQRSWISRRNGCGGDVDCLRDSMQRRLAEFGGQPVPVGSSGPRSAELASSSPRSAQQTNEPTAKSGASAPGQEREQPAISSIREDGIRIHPSGRLIVPHPVRNATSPEARQYQALINHLQHAAFAKRVGSMAPTESPAFFADIARDYLASTEFRPFFCTPDEMNTRSADCMNSADASYAYSMAGGQMNRAAEHSYLWWRGASEFERRRKMQAFAESGLLEQVISAAPEMPVRLMYLADGWLGRYDFEAGHFPFAVSGGIRPVEVPGSHSEAFDLADLVQPASVPPESAEPLLKQLPRNDSGRSELTMGIEVDITLEDPGHESQRPRWQSQVVSSAYFLDANATQPLADVIDEVVVNGASAQVAASGSAPGGGLATRGDMAPDVLRTFDLRREDGRIVLAFDGYGEPTASTEEAVKHMVASASRDLLQAISGGDLNKYHMPLLRAILREDLRDELIGSGGFAGETEFQVRRAKTAFESEVAPTLVTESPPLPIPMRLYLDATLSEYNFEEARIGLRVFQEKSLRIGGSYPISLQPFFDLVPGALPMAPDAAERLVNAVDAGSSPVLQLDFDVMTTRLNGVEFLMTARPVSVALMTGENRDVMHYQYSYDTADDARYAADATRDFLGPESAEAAVTSRTSDYSVLGVAPGMELETALDGLSRHFSDAEIDHSDNLLRAERGWCSYDSVESDNVVDAQGAVCFVARVKHGRISRVALQRVVSTGVTGELLQEHRDAFGKHDSRWDGNAPAGSLGREILSWGEEIDRDRSALGRDSDDLVPREAELEIVYLSPQISVLTLRVDAAASVAPSATDGGTATSAAQKPTATGADDGRIPDSGHASPETATNEAVDAELALLGIALGMERAEARAILENRFGDTALARAEDGTLIVESGPCRYAAAVDPAIEAEVGSNCVMVVFGPDDAVSNVVVRYVVAGSHVDAYATQLEGNFGVPASRVRTEQATETLIIGWGPELEGTAAELERDASAGQTLHALEARLTQANGVTLATARLDSEPVLSGSAATDEGDAGDFPPPIEF